MTTGKIAPWFGQPGGGTQLIKYKPNGELYSVKGKRKTNPRLQPSKNIRHNDRNASVLLQF
jgi:hypothetical protein